MLSVQAYLEVTGMYDLANGAALAVILLLPSVTAFLVQRYWVAQKRYVMVTGKPLEPSLRPWPRSPAAPLRAACLVVALFIAALLRDDRGRRLREDLGHRPHLRPAATSWTPSAWEPAISRHR